MQQFLSWFVCVDVDVDVVVDAIVCIDVSVLGSFDLLYCVVYN